MPNPLRAMAGTWLKVRICFTRSMPVPSGSPMSLNTRSKPGSAMAASAWLTEWVAVTAWPQRSRSRFSARAVSS